MRYFLLAPYVLERILLLAPYPSPTPLLAFIRMFMVYGKEADKCRKTICLADFE